MPSAPPRCASTAAHTGSGSYVRRACRSVATWSMLTPSSIMRGRIVGRRGVFSMRPNSARRTLRWMSRRVYYSPALVRRADAAGKRLTDALDRPRFTREGLTVSDNQPPDNADIDEQLQERLDAVS